MKKGFFMAVNILNRMKGLSLLAILTFVALCFTGPIVALAAGPAPVNLLSAGNFVILSEAGITNTGSHASFIIGNIGSSPITAAAMNDVFCSEITGTIYGVDAAYVGSGSQVCFAGNPPLANKTLVDNAVGDMVTAYNNAAAVVAPAPIVGLGAGNIGGMTLAPGLYKWSTNVIIPTNVTLSGGASDVWIFQIAGDLNIASGGSVPAGIKVVLTGGAQASNVFWQVGGGTGATLGTYSTFNGTILSAKQIILQTGAVLYGRALAQTQVTLDANIVNIVTSQPPPGTPTLGKGFSPATINEGCGGSDHSTLTITLSNPNATAATITSLTDTLPVGTKVAGTPNAGNTCVGGTFNPSAGDTILTMTGGTISGGAPGICTLQVDVCAPTLGTNRSYVNTLPIGALVTSNGNNANSALATLIVLSPAPGPQAPTISKFFHPVLITAADISTLTFTLSNPSTNTTNTNVTFTDNLPPGLVIARTPFITNSCNGSVSAIPLGNTVTLTGGSIPAATSCTVTVNVRVPDHMSTGTFTNTLIAGDLSSDQGDNVIPAVATLTVTPANRPTPVPTLNEWGVIIFMVLAGLGSVYYLRKYKRV
jgi:uncharacterized repeat protein (TIGR01451 family)